MTSDEFEENDKAYKRRRNLLLILVAGQLVPVAISFRNLNKARELRNSYLSRLAVVQKEIDYTQAALKETKKICGAVR